MFIIVVSLHNYLFGRPAKRDFLTRNYSFILSFKTINFKFYPTQQNIQPINRLWINIP